MSARPLIIDKAKRGKRRFFILDHTNRIILTTDETEKSEDLMLRLVAFPKAPLVGVRILTEASEEDAKRIVELVRKRITTAFLPPRHLSKRQQEVLDGVQQNLGNKEIAARLNICVRTVKFHISCLLEKYEARDRYHLRDLTGSP